MSLLENIIAVVLCCAVPHRNLTGLQPNRGALGERALPVGRDKRVIYGLASFVSLEFPHWPNH